MSGDPKLFALLALGREKGADSHSSILAWKIPRTEEPGRLQSMGTKILPALLLPSQLPRFFVPWFPHMY